MRAPRLHPASAEDAQDLEDFLSLINGEHYRPLARGYIHSMFSDDFRRPTFLLLKEMGKIIGAAAYSEELFTVDTWGISWVSVHPDKRNKGCGQKLVQACLQAISRTARRSVTVILATHPEKTGLYEKIGFQPAGKDHDGGAFMIMPMK